MENTLDENKHHDNTSIDKNDEYSRKEKKNMGNVQPAIDIILIIHGVNHVIQSY